MKPKTRLYSICAILAIGSSQWGYNIGILASVLAHPAWLSLHAPTPSQKGIVTGIYYLGTLLSYILAAPLADYLGRRYAALSGTAVLSVGVLFMAGSSGLPTMLLGRWISGLGVGVVSTTVPIYQSEVAPAKERGKFVTLNHVGFITGLATGLWVGYGFSHWSADISWRASLLVGLLPAVVFASSLLYLPDTPRWLVQHNKSSRAKAVLSSLRSGSVAAELSAIENDAAAHTRTTRALFTDCFPRLWRAFLLQFMAQMCGATAMKYYLPSLLAALGVEYKLALMAGAVEMTAKIGLTVVEMWLIDRIGRRSCLVGGSLIMGSAMLVNGVLPLLSESTGANVVCLVFIFVYAMGYSLGLGPAAWVYSAEIFPTAFRARGLNFAASGGAVGSLVVAQVWPIGQARFGSGVYLFFMAVNFICVPVIWRLYPETKGRALEDMDALFGEPERRVALQDAETDEDVPLLQ